jgi:hypothetical protein
MTSIRKNYERLTARRIAASLSRQRILEMMRMAFGDRRLKVAGIGGTLREYSMSLGRALAASEDAGAPA